METKKFDIVVVGAGISGIAAAVGASKKGFSVALIDQNSTIGGSSVHSEIGTICGILKNYTKENKYLVNGFPRKFAEKIHFLSKSTIQNNKLGLNFIPYDSESFLNASNYFLGNKKIERILECQIQHTEIKGKKIDFLIGKQKGNKIKIVANQFVDCSGNSTISRFAPIKTLPKSVQNAAYSFLISGVSAKNELQINLALMKSIRKGVENKLLNAILLQTFPIQGSFLDSKLRLKITLLEDFNFDQAIFLSQNLTEYLSKLEGVFHGIKIEKTSSQLGVRSSICSIGKEVLTHKDVIHSTKQTEWIARADWPIEIWEDGKTHLEHSKHKDFYEISWKHILSKDFDNLYFGGKMISADSSAIASARVQGICIQTGYACGFLAQAKLNQKSLNESVKLLQEELLYDEFGI